MLSQPALSKPVGLAFNGQEGLEKAIPSRPDVSLTDLVAIPALTPRCTPVSVGHHRTQTGRAGNPKPERTTGETGD